MILLHIVPLRMAFGQCSVFSDSADGEETSTSGIRWRALSKLRLRWCCVMLIRVLVTCDTGGKRIPIDFVVYFFKGNIKKGPYEEPFLLFCVIDHIAFDE